MTFGKIRPVLFYIFYYLKAMLKKILIIVGLAVLTTACS